MMRLTNSRGKKQRIKKRIDKLEGREPVTEDKPEKVIFEQAAPKKKIFEEPKISA